ncbi:MAG: hypothetical protein K0S47_3307 [Herbinix sp.]|nr:hypothetical protein [Herbinix sp.]
MRMVILMSNERTRYDLTSADTKIIGFDYQYFYFINELLKLSYGETVGFEVKDDVHIDLPNNNLVLIQNKHTIQKNSKDKPINLTEMDDDLWKSLSNWTKVIKEGRTTSAQIEFIKKVDFIFVTNKLLDKNKPISNIKLFINKKITFTKLIAYLKELHSLTLDKDVKEHLNDVISLDTKVLSAYIKKIKFINSSDDIVDEIKQNIQGKMITLSRVNDVFNDLFSELKQDFFSEVKKGKHQIISYNEWLTKYIRIFENYRQTNLPIRYFKPIFPDDLSEQPFIKELIEIGEVEKDDFVQIVQFSEYMLTVQLNLNKWYEDGEITNIDKENFKKSAISIWRNIHRKSHRTTKSNMSLNNVNSINCLDDIRDKNLKMITTEIGVDLSNGEFYLLSNEGAIGWKLEWEAKY